MLCDAGMLDSQPPQSTLEQEPDDEEEGEEERIWAEDQIRKGISTKVLRAPEIHSKQLERTAKVSIPESTPRPVSVAALKEHHLSVMKASENALSSLHQAVARLQHSESQATKNLSKMKEKLIHSKSVVDQIEADLAFAGGKYMFFQKLVAYMSNLCTMLAEKSPIIETLEEESQSIMRERALAQYFKSIDSFHEDMDPIEAGIQAASTVLNHNAMSATAATANEAEAAFMKALEDRDAQIAGGKHIPVKLDEFGRDESSNRRLRSAARRKRRAVQEEVMAAKLYPSFKAQTAQVLEPEVGGETTSESEGEEDSFLQRKSEILGAAGLVFQDVVEEYASLEAVCAQLEGWKLKYPVQYEEVYMKLSMPVLVSPFVRLELLTWSPLFQGPQTVQAIRGQNWYGVLSKYGAHSVEKKPESDSDLSEEENYEGRDVICKLVQALVLPQATFLVRDCWNPYSAEDSLAIASMLTEILQYVPQNSEEWRTLVSEVNDQLDKSISRLKVPAWSDATIEACGKSRSRVLYHSARCFGRALRVLRSVCAFQDVLGYSPVHNLAISRIVVALLVPYALSSPYHGVKGQRVKRIVESLPQNWVLVEGGVESCGLKGALTSLQEAAQLLLHETGKPEHVNTASHVASALDKLGEGSLALQLRLGFGG